MSFDLFDLLYYLSISGVRVIVKIDQLEGKNAPILILSYFEVRSSSLVPGFS